VVSEKASARALLAGSVEIAHPAMAWRVANKTWTSHALARAVEVASASKVADDRHRFPASECPNDGKLP